jgi:hypothetical protein
MMRKGVNTPARHFNEFDIRTLMNGQNDSMLEVI